MKNKRLIITAGAKGGSGKSLTSTILYSWLESQGGKTIAFDGDQENSTLLRFIPESRFIDMRQPTAIDEILSPIVSGEADTVLLDSRAATSEEMVQWLKQIGIDAIRTELKTSVTVVGIVTHSKDTLEQLLWWTNELGTSVDWLIVRNLLGEQVDEYDRSKLRRKVIEELGGKELTLPKLPPFLIQVLEQHSLTIHKAIAAEAVTWTNQKRFQALELELNTQIETLKGTLLP